MSRKIQFKFDETKAAQVAARLINKSGGKLNYLLATKILYAIDRAALANWGKPVMGGSYSSLPKGPVISEALDLMKKGKEENASSFWTAHIITKNYDLHLKKDPGSSELSEAEAQLVDDVHAMLAHRNRWDVVKWTHDEFQEWKDPKGSSKPIDVAAMLRAVGKTPKDIRSIAKESAYYQKFDALLGPGQTQKGTLAICAINFPLRT